MRQIVSEHELASDGTLLLTGKQAYHLCKVLRVTSGDMLYVRLPKGVLQPMTVSRVDENAKELVLSCAGSVVTRVNNALPTKKAEGPRLWLFQFVPKPVKMELIVRQATECGVEKIIPVAGSFCQKSALDSVRKRSDGDNARWNRIITEAMEQSGSAVHTQIMPCVSVQEACDLWKRNKDHALALCMYEQSAGTLSLHEAVAANPQASLAALAVGAEGGIAPSEFSLLCECGFTGVHFATNILRCETAALYGMAALQTALRENTVWQYNA